MNPSTTHNSLDVYSILLTFDNEKKDIEIRFKKKKTIKHENLFQRQYYRKALAMEQIFEYLPINDNFSMSTVPVERKRQEMSLVMNK